jgi:hypothetical protein
MTRLFTALAAGLMLFSTPLLAKQIGAFKDWTAHAEGKGKSKTCWIYSEPVKHEGKYKKRGRIYTMVSYILGGKTVNQVQLTAGYTFKKGSSVKVVIGKRTFDLFTNADKAWGRSEKDDAALVKAMRAGSKMIVTGVSSRGNRTKDTYSLSGISAAHKAIGKTCRMK